jgi:hypothetical protein
MAQAASIPEELHTRVVEWWLSGLSPRKIRDRLLDEHEILTSHTSVQRIVNRTADGCGDGALAATVMRIRLQSTLLADCLDEHLEAIRVASGVAAPAAGEPGPRDLDWRLLDQADRMTIRHLRLAGVGTRAGQKAVEKYEAEQRRLGDARRETLGITWPIAEPEDAPVVDIPAPVPVTATPGTTPTTAVSEDQSRDSVRVPAPAPALMAEDHAYAAPPRAPVPPSREVAIPAGLRPRHPCPCGSGLRFKHCHGKTGNDRALQDSLTPADAATQH